MEKHRFTRCFLHTPALDAPGFMRYLATSGRHAGSSERREDMTGKKDQAFISTTSYHLWGDAVTVHCFGSLYGDWSLRGATPDEAERNNPGSISRVGSLARHHGRDIYVPDPSTFNARIARPLKGAYEKWCEGLYRGVLADGLSLAFSSDAFGVTSSDCPTIVLYEPTYGTVVAAHAGRDSLIDRDHVNGGVPREYFSVVDAMMPSLHRKSLAPGCKAFITCGIHPDHFTHPVDDPMHGAHNRRMIEYVVKKWGEACVPDGVQQGKLWLAEIARRQLEQHGLHPANIATDAVDTYGDCGKDGKPLWHSHRRDGSRKRNFVLVMKEDRHI